MCEKGVCGKRSLWKKGTQKLHFVQFVEKLLCDEPTGALDSKTSREVLVLLEKINAQYGTTMPIVTHNNSIKQMVHLKDGQIKKSYTNATRVPAEVLKNRE